MTFGELAEKVSSIKGVYPKFKQIDKGRVVIFWKGHYPIASVFAHEFEYRLDYPKLYEMDLNEILQIDAWLYEYVGTEIEDRDIF